MVGALSLVQAACNDQPVPAPRLQPAATPRGPEVRFDTVTVRVELARTAAEQARGLGGHAPLGEREGMLFIFARPGVYSFWMKGMTFPLDIIWIADDEVVYVLSDAPYPPPGAPDTALPVYTPPLPASYVLEVAAGSAARWGIRPGTRLTFHGVPLVSPG